MPDFFSLLNASNPTAGLQSALLSLFDKILQGGHVSEAQADAIAKVRSQVAILLKTL